MRKKINSPEILHITILDKVVPIHIYRERRNSVRYSFGKKKLIFRVPLQLGETIISEKIRAGINWATQLINKKPSLLNKLVRKDYKSEFTMIVLDKSYNLKINKNEGAKKTSYVTNDSNIEISGNEEDLKTNLSHYLSKVFKSLVSQTFFKEVYDINEKYFSLNINRISLKYNSSNWGSCSTKSNLNFSTRTLLLPKQIRYYIIVHELSHLIEMNHSPRFWNEVSKRYPNYKDAEKFLKKHGNEYDF